MKGDSPRAALPSGKMVYFVRNKFGARAFSGRLGISWLVDCKMRLICLVWLCLAYVTREVYVAEGDSFFGGENRRYPKQRAGDAGRGVVSLNTKLSI